MDAKEIQKLRKDLNCTQEDFAKILGITVAALSRWENGSSKPNKKNIEQMLFLKQKLSDGKDGDKLKKKLLAASVLIGAIPGVGLALGAVGMLAAGLISKDSLKNKIEELFK